VNRAERRTVPRRVPNPAEVTARLRLRTGHELLVLDISEHAARVEGDTRLLPGARIEVRMATQRGRMTVRGRIMRSRVCRLSAGAVCYESVLLFDTPVG
jgi:hypothetical protein